MIADILVGGLIVIINLIAIFVKKGRYVPLAVSVSVVIALIYNFLRPTII